MARTHTRRRRRSGAQGGRVAVAQGSGHGLSDSGRQKMKRLFLGRTPGRKRAHARFQRNARTVAGRCSKTTLAFDLLQLALTHPRFENEALSRVRAQIIQSLQQDQAEPQRLASRGFMRQFFGGHAYAHPVTGEIDSISSITAADLRNFARGYWVKNGLKVAVARGVT